MERISSATRTDALPEEGGAADARPARDAGDRGTDAIVGDLTALIRRQRRALAHRWTRGDLSMTHLHVLLALEDEGPVPMTRLAAMLGCSTPNATGIVDRMVERGLIDRARDDSDRRLVRVCATPAGRRLLDEFELGREQRFREILDAMTEEERDVCARAVRVMLRAAERLDEAAAPAIPDAPARP